MADISLDLSRPSLDSGASAPNLIMRAARLHIMHQRNGPPLYIMVLLGIAARTVRCQARSHRESSMSSPELAVPTENGQC